MTEDGCAVELYRLLPQEQNQKSSTLWFSHGCAHSGTRSRHGSSDQLLRGMTLLATWPFWVCLRSSMRVDYQVCIVNCFGGAR